MRKAVGAGLVCFLWAFRPAPGAGAPPRSPEAVGATVEEVVQAGRFDIDVVKAIRDLPREALPRLAARLLESTNAAMRSQAILLLETNPSESATASLRKVLADPNPGNRARAALYLAKQAGDPRARQLLLEAAADPDPRLALPAVECLGRLGGTNVPVVLRKLLEGENIDGRVRRAAITAAGSARAAECTPALLKLLASQELRGQHRTDTVRLCDMAAAALEQIHPLGIAETPAVYFSGPVAKRDECIAQWRQWGTQGGTRTQAPSWDANVARLVAECFPSLLDPATPPEQRQAGKRRIAAVMRTTFCLGDLPGVDAVAGPAAQDVVCIVRALGEPSRQQFVNCWQSLQAAYEKDFLPAEKARSAKPDGQASEFIGFAERQTGFPRLWVWSLCRNFVERFPDSAARSQIDGVRVRLEAGFAQEKKRVVLHGHIPVLEPLPARSPPAGATMMTPDGPTAVYDAVYASPSDWSLHRDAIDLCRRTNVTAEDYPFFPQQSKLYPGSEWPFLANAAYKLRVRKSFEAALDFANRALILNPANAKSLAVRGIIQMAAGHEDAALRDLAAACGIDPRSLGDEPETVRAVVLLAAGALRNEGDGAAVRTHLAACGDLRAYGEKQPVSANPAYKEAMRKLGPARPAPALPSPSRPAGRQAPGP